MGALSVTAPGCGDDDSAAVEYVWAESEYLRSNSLL